jgi:hypothetical protein
MSTEIIWRLTEPERKALMTEIHALNNNDKALAIDFIKESRELELQYEQDKQSSS